MRNLGRAVLPAPLCRAAQNGGGWREPVGVICSVQWQGHPDLAVAALNSLALSPLGS